MDLRVDPPCFMRKKTTEKKKTHDLHIYIYKHYIYILYICPITIFILLIIHIPKTCIHIYIYILYYIISHRELPFQALGPSLASPRRPRILASRPRFLAFRAM